MLGAAFLHAAWNAVLRRGADRVGLMLALALTQSGFALLLLPFFPAPAAAAWPFLAASWVFHTGYKLFLLRAYGHGDFGQVYPIARGAAPLMVGVVGALLLGEVLSPPRAAALLAIVAGVMLVGSGAGPGRRMPLKALGYALGSASFTAAYTLVDGVGARLGGDASSFTLWMFAGDGLFMLAYGVLSRGRGVVGAVRANALPGGIAGLLSLGSYWIAIWAFTRAPIALVAALRETSVFFAIVLGVLVFHERITRRRMLAAALIVLGAAALRLA